MNVYESIPTMEKGEIRLRPVTAEDEAVLLRVYGDPLALPFFNSDNCHGDIFYYDTPEKMRRAMDFWRTSWEQGWFVRWAIALRSEVIGTVELCRRGESPDDPYSGMGILRVDVGSAWEKSDVLAAVMDALLPDAYALLNCRTLMTKAAPYAVARVATLTECGFVRSDKPVMGHHGERFEAHRSVRTCAPRACGELQLCGKLQLRDFRLELRNRVHEAVGGIFAIGGGAADGDKLDAFVKITAIHFCLQLNHGFSQLHANCHTADFIGVLCHNVAHRITPPEILLHS